MHSPLSLGTRLRPHPHRSLKLDVALPVSPAGLHPVGMLPARLSPAKVAGGHEASIIALIPVARAFSQDVGETGPIPSSPAKEEPFKLGFPSSRVSSPCTGMEGNQVWGSLRVS